MLVQNSSGQKGCVWFSAPKSSQISIGDIFWKGVYAGLLQPFGFEVHGGRLSNDWCKYLVQEGLEQRSSALRSLHKFRSRAYLEKGVNTKLWQHPFKFKVRGGSEYLVYVGVEQSSKPSVQNVFQWPILSLQETICIFATFQNFDNEAGQNAGLMAIILMRRTTYSWLASHILIRLVFYGLVI